MDDQPFFVRVPKWQIVFAVIGGFLAYTLINFLLGGTQKNQGAIYLDLFLYLGGIFFWLFFFAQFVLPVRTVEERFMVFVRLVRYLTGQHGPVVLIEEGEVIQRADEAQRQFPGIALVNCDSAAMLRTATRFTRPVGPGVVFTNYSFFTEIFEYVANPVDLRQHTQLLGPRWLEDPFAIRQEGEDEPAFGERQRRRMQTSALTRNGIEVTATIIVIFRLNADDHFRGTPFDYDPAPVRRASTGAGVDPDMDADDARRNVMWSDLPAFLVADVWREALTKFTLEDLFSEVPGPIPPQLQINTSPMHPQPTGLQLIIAWINQRLVNRHCIELDDFGHPLRTRMPSRENRLLRERGIRVFVVVINNLRLHADVESQITQSWEANWLNNAQLERRRLEEQISQLTIASQITALQRYARACSQALAVFPPGINHPPTPLVKALVEESLNFCLFDPQLAARTGLDQGALRDLVDWLNRQL